MIPNVPWFAAGIATMWILSTISTWNNVEQISGLLISCRADKIKEMAIVTKHLSDVVSALPIPPDDMAQAHLNMFKNRTRYLAGDGVAR